MEYLFYIFDLDGTLSPTDQEVLYPDAAKWLEANHHNWVICTNQGGIGLRLWMEKGGFGDPGKYSTLDKFSDRLDKLFPWIDRENRIYYVLMCTAYQSKKTGQWAPTPPSGVGYAMWNQDWRKPAPGMLIHAMAIRGFIPAKTLMVGDSLDDQGAAQAAGVDFQPAWQFFGRPEEKLR